MNDFSYQFDAPMSNNLMPSVPQVQNFQYSPENWQGFNNQGLDLTGLNLENLSDGFANLNLPQTELSWSDRLFGTDGKGGMAMPLFNLAKTGAQTYLGLKQLGVAEDTLDFQKNAFSKQFGNQASLVNTQLRDRQRARVARNPGAISVDEYMRQNAVQQS